MPEELLMPSRSKHVKVIYRLCLVVCLFALGVTPALADGESGTGAIQGELGYPSHFVPQLRVYAINADPSGPTYVIETALNQTTFIMSGLQPGTYYVVGYLADTPSFAGAYTAAVPCGLLAECTDHSLIPVTVTAGATTGGVEVRDWYAPPGTFPSEPTSSVPAGTALLPGTGAVPTNLAPLLIVTLVLLIMGLVMRMMEKRPLADRR